MGKKTRSKARQSPDPVASEGVDAADAAVTQADLDELASLLGGVAESDLLEALSKVHGYVTGLAAGAAPTIFVDKDVALFEVVKAATARHGKEAGKAAVVRHVALASRLFEAREGSARREDARSVVSSVREVARPTREATKKCTGCGRPRTQCECIEIAEEYASAKRSAKKSARKKEDASQKGKIKINC
jgi:hypothetical protein